MDVEDRRATLLLSGELDIATAPAASTLLDSLITMGTRDITVDLARVTFIDASGLNVLAAAAGCLALSSGRLSITAATAQTERLLHITNLSPLLRASTPIPGPTADPAHADGNRGSVDAALSVVASLALDILGGADGVGVSLRRGEMITTAAATEDLVIELDHAQYDSGEGPCIAAVQRGIQQHIRSLDGEPRWPVFVSKARCRGVGSMLSTPLLHHHRSLGALNVYAFRPGAFDPDDEELAQVFAGRAAAMVATGAA